MFDFLTKRNNFISNIKQNVENDETLIIKDIKPIDCFGQNLLNSSNYEDVIDNIVELPLRNACKTFRRKGIETVMSSANENNVLANGQKPLEKENVSGNANSMFMSNKKEIPKYDGKDVIYSPTFEDAGKGYSWIMINYETLSDENKDLLFELEEKRDKDGNRIGEKRVWFVKSAGLTGMLFGVSLEESDSRSEKFKNRSIELTYNNRYPKKVVMLRFPVNQNTTVKEVTQYFSRLAERFKEQNRAEKIQTGLREEIK